MTAPQYVLQGSSKQVIVMVPYSAKEGDESDTSDYVQKQYEFIDYLKTELGQKEGEHGAQDILSLCTIIPQNRFEEIANHQNGIVMVFIEGNFVKSYARTAAPSGNICSIRSISKVTPRTRSLTPR